MTRPVYRALWTDRATKVPRRDASPTDKAAEPEPVRQMTREVVCIPHPREPTVLVVACVVCGEHQPVCQVGYERMVLALTSPLVAQFIINHHRWCGPQQSVRSEWTYSPNAVKAPRA